MDAERLEASDDLREFDRPEFCVYAADGGGVPEFVDDEDNTRQGWSPSSRMPRWASRITLELTEVRVQRLQSISETDAQAEGADPIAARVPTHRDAFRYLWDDRNSKESWDANPWVWVLSFKVLPPLIEKPPTDFMTQRGNN